MNARQKLNIAYFNGSLLLAIVAGIWCQSWILFFAILIVGIAISLCVGEIRPPRRD